MKISLSFLMVKARLIFHYRVHIHFLLAVGFAVSYISGELDIETLHFIMGYILVAILGFRFYCDITKHSMRPAFHQRFEKNLKRRCENTVISFSG